jgi:acyl dehydratase
MAINYEELIAAEYNDVPVSYQNQDVILYALGVGLGRELGNSRELAYVYERLGPQTLPSYASMLTPDDLLRNSGCNVERMLHRSQSIELFRPLPGSGEFLINQKVVHLFDLGANKGADIEVESEIRRRKDDTVFCVLGSRMILREDGGFSGPPPTARKRHNIPSRDADMIFELQTRQDQALLFRLSGDHNPLHVDPSAAKDLGFESPILHGRCTYGIACYAILKMVCDYDFMLLKNFDARFSAPVYPGDLIRTEIWQDREVVSFRCRVPSRDAVVINNGRCVLNT